MVTRVEVLISDDLIERGENMLRAMVATAPAKVQCIVRPAYVGDCPVLMTYGLGHPVRRPQWQGHVQPGRRVIGWDLGYWERRQGAMRLSVDADHPQAWLQPEDGARWASLGIPLRDDYSPHGPIILVGMGWKSKRIFYGGGRTWEDAALARIRAAYPRRQVVFKPKRDIDVPPPGCAVRKEPIEDVLRGASLVVCRHSNVAVDACVAGVPVVCDDGAAAALYGNDLKHPANPSPEARLAFLQSLAWWQWKPAEARGAWDYLKRRGVV